ncbi:phosphoribosylamine-glycine ligase [Lapidilactobacillus dextrinicus DSM 20335]|uniref:Phosphoribosylamine--glycine ligase n=1 Tax=Lapidilactobacillus dextrinicus DSM 20335 TaxID=1423738 RepID=A0A0R2BQ84_9LACO|nr:phosphoribosylamine--glycine ligase [Lapidilactobacillus dextrinicus]KRM78425.1 phosphoribosylamine-glycine ligase [Lapidilactobacillus dextrinicus DSM 20335]QFG47227.1 phosphoribosylamine--glycine ligase [Lapidilactobacillus dextrinicus]
MAKVLIIGSGAREHAIARAFQQSPKVMAVYAAPGNDGMRREGIMTLPIVETDFSSLIVAAQKYQIDLTFVGGEVPLVNGIVDAFTAAGLLIFGPKKAAAQLEGSKAFMKKILLDHQIPTAQARTVTSLAAAQAAVQALGYPIVIKTDALAAGKGVTIHRDAQETAKFLAACYQRQEEMTLVIEEYLSGFEFSLFSLVGRNQIVHAPLAHDYKRRYDHDQGLNTGGMGAYSPVPEINSATLELTIRTLVMPTLAALQEMNTPFSGVLYTGVMLTASGPKVIEYNVRLGDPETQVVLPQLTSDFYDLISGLVTGQKVTPQWQTEKSFVGVVLTDPDYPQGVSGNYLLPDLGTDVLVDYTHSAQGQQTLLSHGGRVATVVSSGVNKKEARQTIYQTLQAADLPLAYRHDIAQTISEVTYEK